MLLAKLSRGPKDTAVGPIGRSIREPTGPRREWPLGVRRTIELVNRHTMGGGWAVAVSVALAAWLLARPRVGLNALSAWTVVLGLAGGVIAIAWPAVHAAMWLSIALIVLALYPALVGGEGLLYLPAVVLIALPLRRADTVAVS